MFSSISSIPSTNQTSILFIPTGTGVPVCLAGAKVTAEQILNHEKIPIPWASDERKAGQHTSSSVLDMKDKPARLAFLSLPQFLMLVAALIAFLYGGII